MGNRKSSLTLGWVKYSAAIGEFIHTIEHKAQGASLLDRAHGKPGGSLREHGLSGESHLGLRTFSRRANFRVLVKHGHEPLRSRTRRRENSEQFFSASWWKLFRRVKAFSFHHVEPRLEGILFNRRVGGPWFGWSSVVGDINRLEEIISECLFVSLPVNEAKTITDFHVIFIPTFNCSSEGKEWNTKSKDKRGLGDFMQAVVRLHGILVLLGELKLLPVLRVEETKAKVPSSLILSVESLGSGLLHELVPVFRKTKVLVITLAL
mmetsp:Transcript_28834/g.49140  ORF Transcript_28834/g.49140 Transcript_28834/m.49140 type:complete len:264 (+) Transcript_28834:2034-2825(+)